jgi:hypothetical protein
MKQIMYYTAKSVKDELDKHTRKYPIKISGGSNATFGCPRNTGYLYSKCSGNPNNCATGKSQTCHQMLTVDYIDNNGNAYLLAHLTFDFAIPSSTTKSKYDGFIRYNKLKGLSHINFNNLVEAKV